MKPPTLKKERSNSRGAPWTEDAVRMLIRLAKTDKLSANEIANALEYAMPGCNKSRAAVVAKAHRLGIAIRPDIHWKHPNFNRRAAAEQEAKQLQASPSRKAAVSESRRASVKGGAKQTDKTAAKPTPAQRRTN